MEEAAMTLMTHAPPQLPGTLEGLVELATTALGVIDDQQTVMMDLTTLLQQVEHHLEGQPIDVTLLLFDTRDALRQIDRSQAATRPWRTRLGGA
jgi:hypothetical protein